jgi:hypothetical protein
MGVSPAFAQTLTVVYPWQDSRPAMNARLLAKTMVKYLNVKNIEFKFMPGANGIVAANYVYALPDTYPNYVIGTFNRNIPYVGVVGGKNVRFESVGFNWLGSTDDGRHDSMILLSRKTYDGNLVVGSDTIDISNPVEFIRRTLNWNIRHVTGYQGNNEVRLALERNEIDAMLVNYNSIKFTRPRWLTEYLILFQFGNGDRRNDELPNVETLYNMVDDKRELVKLELQYMLVRPFVASPNVRPDALEALRTAFKNAAHDVEYLDEARKSDIPVNFIDWRTTTQAIKMMKEQQ